jgi:D-aminoacyl-tRNA deacylase
MTVLIIASNKDPASINIKKNLLKISSWEEINSFCDNIVYRHYNMKDVVIITLNDRKIMHENIDKEVEDKLGIKPKQAIFISRHTSKTGQPTLTVHPIGNYGEAHFGGYEKTLSESSPRLMTCLLRIMKKNAKQANLYHQVCFEVTHHGPYLSIPSFFVEVGSTKDEWEKNDPAYIVAKSVLELLDLYHYEKDLPNDIPILIGVGGGHYAPRFTDVVLEKKASFGHMIPTYQLKSGNINEMILEQVIELTPNVSSGYFHRKALKKSQIRQFKKWFEQRGIPIISSKKLQDFTLETS